MKRGKRRWQALLPGVAAAILAVSIVALHPRDARSFVLDDALTNGTPDDPSDDLRDAARWSYVTGSLVEDGQRGLGGGLEYAVTPEFCERLLPRFIDQPRPGCAELRAAIQRAFDRWADGHPMLHFVDVGDRVFPVLLPLTSELGAEIDLVAVSRLEFPPIGAFGSFSSFSFQRVAPIGANGRAMPGKTLTAADIAFNVAACFHLDPTLEGRGCNHFESLLLHEIGHALALDHPNEFPERNFDSDDDPATPVAIDCDAPSRGLRLSQAIDGMAVMNSSGGRPEPVHSELTADDFAGRDFLYPVCHPPGAGRTTWRTLTS